ncbi:hypothetical protein Tco_1569903 [Tanacetum coccineum]
MVNYSLWEVIENGNAPPITKLVEGVETIIAPSTAEIMPQRRVKAEVSDLSKITNSSNTDTEKSERVQKKKPKIQASRKKLKPPVKIQSKMVNKSQPNPNP